MRHAGWIVPTLLAASAVLTPTLDAYGAELTATSGPPVTHPSWKAEGDQYSALFGAAVGTAGDVNGDGYADVIVGSYYYNGQKGRAFVYHGSAAGLSSGFDWWAESDDPGAAWFGYSVATAGDVNGDGYDDVIVGAPYYSIDGDSVGGAFVFHGSAAGLSSTPDWTAHSDQVLANFGNSVATSGDVNGDGYDDVIVGAQYYDHGQTAEGRAYLYLGSAGGLSITPGWIAESDVAVAYFGSSVGTAGDVNGDGYADVIVGARWYDDGPDDEGWAFLYQGSAAGLSTTAAWTVEGDQLGANVGAAVGTAGDVNGDGYDDVVVGAPYYVSRPGAGGRAYLYQGSAAGLSTTPDWIARSNQDFSNFGVSVGTAGDVNGDGYEDVIVGAYRYDNGQADEGRAFIFQGSGAGLGTTADWKTESNQDHANLGSSVATAGDVNGDGYADVIVGAPGYDSGHEDEGVAVVFGGRPLP
jgi:hypothetical protein